ncbi:hypothetical protein Hanom_Chr08g00713361 [Helianthus anomalus]
MPHDIPRCYLFYSFNFGICLRTLFYLFFKYLLVFKKLVPSRFDSTFTVSLFLHSSSSSSPLPFHSSSDHQMDKENLFNFPNDFPYEFTSTDDKPKTFKEPTLGRSGCSHFQPLMPPVFAKGDEDAWNMIYAAASQVARMKMKMSNKDVTGIPHQLKINVTVLLGSSISVHKLKINVTNMAQFNVHQLF